MIVICKVKLERDQPYKDGKLLKELEEMTPEEFGDLIVECLVNGFDSKEVLLVEIQSIHREEDED